jgi:protein kinase C substrate 80K-H
MRLVVLLAGSVAASVLGVAPERQALYATTDGAWRCLGDPSIVLAPTQINDGYCDCPDGSDEPGTSACSAHAAPFYCANEGHVPGLLEHFKVGDGVCDYDVCCDGSDEGARCPSKCAEVHRQYEEYRRRHRALLQEAMAARERYAAQAQQLRRELELAAANHRHVVALDEATLQKVGSAPAAPLTRLEAALEADRQRLAATRTHLGRAEAILARLAASYNPNFNDPAVKEAVHAFQDYISNKPEEAPERDLLGLAREVAAAAAQTAPTAPHRIVPTLSNMLHYYYAQLIGRFESAPPPPPRNDPALEAELADKRAALASMEGDLVRDYGPNDIFRGVKGKWVSAKLGEYTYRVGLLDAIYQEGNGHNVHIGRFAAIDGADLVYTHGARCWNGPQRLARVHLVCGPHHELVAVSEPEKCEYAFELTTPLACARVDDAELARGFRVDYANLA